MALADPPLPVFVRLRRRDARLPRLLAGARAWEAGAATDAGGLLSFREAVCYHEGILS